MKRPNSANRDHPYRRFTITLGLGMLILGAVIAVVSMWIINRAIVSETSNLTREAVEKHFVALPQFTGLRKQMGHMPDPAGAPVLKLAETDTGSKAGSADGHAGHDDYDANEAYESYGDPAASDQPANAGAAPSNYDSLLSIVHLHFDLYSIVSTRMYFPNGMVLFSYDKDELGAVLPASARTNLNKALQGGFVETHASGHLLNVTMPIRDGDNGGVLGVVEVTRNIAAQDREIHNVVLALMVSLLVGLLALFLSLRSIYIRSSRTIARQNGELRELLGTVELTHDQSLTALSSALDSRDNETQGHSYRVTSYAIRLGRELGLSEQEVGMLARGALLHDVGKIGVPDSILLKPGKLTDSEWEAMREHVKIGYRMLKHIDFLRPSLDVVQYHHERWDGKGYPHALSGTSIPLSARIFAICDTYDAMTSDRPYRKGISDAEAREEILRCRGTQFCPEVVDAFLRIPAAEWQRIRAASLQAESQIPLDSLLRSA